MIRARPAVLRDVRPFALCLAVCAVPTVTHAEKNVLVVVPMGDASEDLVQFVAKSIEDRLDFEVRIAPPIPHPKEAWYAPRKRWRAEKILDHLDGLDFGPDVWRVAAITEEPISTTKGSVHDWGIAGLGSLGGKSSVFTSYLFRGYRAKARPTYLRFMENLVLHEVGHTLGLEHCPLDRCFMADAKGNAIRAAKRSINEYCPRCHAWIREHLRSREVRGRWSEEERAVLGLAGAKAAVLSEPP
jgi:archaemetzincin